MLTDEELNALFEARGTPDLGRARIRHIRASVPSRTAKTNKKSGKTRYAPLKMPFATEAEATNTEYAALVDYDHDEDTLEYYPQPEPIVITYLPKNSNRKTTIPITPDFFRITRSAFQLIECKQEEELIRLSREMPNRYQRIDGEWRSPPAERAAEEFGCSFIIRSSAQNNWVLLENVELLKDYHVGDLPPIPKETWELLTQRLATDGWASTFDLIHMEPSVQADALYTAIVRHDVFFPLEQSRLSEQEIALVFRDEATFRAHSTFLSVTRPTATSDELTINLSADQLFTWDGEPWRVINPGKNLVTIQRLSAAESDHNLAELSHDQIVQLVRAKRIEAHSSMVQGSANPAEALLRSASPNSIREANWKYEILFGTPSPQNPLVARKKRMRANWLRHYRDAELKYGNGFVGLLSRRSGNRKPKASQESLDLAREVIETDWETIRRKQRMVCHGKYSNQARERGLQPISYQRFCELVKERGGHKQAQSRVGEVTCPPVSVPA